jgi:hypothetical protein
VELVVIILWLLLAHDGSKIEPEPPIPPEKKVHIEKYEEYEEDYYDGTFYEYPCRDRSPRIPCFEAVDD